MSAAKNAQEAFVLAVEANLGLPNALEAGARASVIPLFHRVREKPV